MKTIIDDQIRVAFNNIKKGVSREDMQERLKKILIAYKESLKLSKEQVHNYLVKIESLSDFKLQNVKINAKAPLIGLSLVLLSPSLTACSNNKEIPIKEEKVEESTDLVTMIPKEINKSLNLDRFAYDGMDLDEVKGYLSNFINDGLTKGLYSSAEKTLEITEENKSELASDFVNLYFYLNTKYLDNSIYSIYNLEDIDFDEIYEKSQKAFNYLLEDTYTVTTDTKLLLDRLFIRNTDYQLLRQMYSLIASRNNVNNAEEKEFYTEQIRLNYVHMLNEYLNNERVRVNNQTLQFGLGIVNIADKLSQKDIKNDESLKELYTKIYPILLDEEERNNYDGHEIDSDEFNNALVLKNKNSFIRKIMNTKDTDTTDKSYQELVDEITTQIRISSFKANPYTVDEWLEKEGAKQEIVETPITSTLPEEPEKTEEVAANETPKEEVPVEENKEDTKNPDYENIKNQAINQAKIDIQIYDRAEEDKEKIREYDIPAKPSEDSFDTNAIYDYWYIYTFMEERWKIVFKQKYGNQEESPYLSQAKRNASIEEVIQNYANEILSSYFNVENEESVKKM